MSNDSSKRPGLAYYQAASFALMLILTGFSIAGVWGVAVIGAPALTITSYDWKDLHTRNTYLKQNYVRRNGLYHATAGSDTAGITVDEATERWRDARSEVLGLERRLGVQRVLLWIVALVVCLPLYRYHHRVVERALKSSGDGGA